MSTDHKMGNKKMHNFYKAVITTSIIICLIYLFIPLTGCSNNKKTRLSKGTVVPSFQGQSLDGKQINLSNYKGNPVIIRFFLTDCKYCKADTPVFNKYYNQYKDSGLGIIYINNNASDVTAVKNFTNQLAIEFPVIHDKSGKIAATYNIKAQPLTLILDPEHRLLAALLGGVSEEELQELINPYLN